MFQISAMKVIHEMQSKVSRKHHDEICNKRRTTLQFSSSAKIDLGRPLPQMAAI
jgi:hypothetical protein